MVSRWITEQICIKYKVIKMKCMARPGKACPLIKAWTSEYFKPTLNQPVLAVSNWSVNVLQQQPHLTKSSVLLKSANVFLQTSWFLHLHILTISFCQQEFLSAVLINTRSYLVRRWIYRESKPILYIHDWYSLTRLTKAQTLISENSYLKQYRR